jgi:hypothetical protein
MFAQPYTPLLQRIDLVPEPRGLVFVGFRLPLELSNLSLLVLEAHVGLSCRIKEEKV